MGDDRTVARLLDVASKTHLHASLMRRSRGLMGWWRERTFATAVDQFADAIRALPQSEVETAPEESIRRIGDMVDAIIEDVEQFIASHRATNLKRVERDRFLVRHIYELRASYEKVSRRVAPRLDMADLRQRVKQDSSLRS